MPKDYFYNRVCVFEQICILSYLCLNNRLSKLWLLFDFVFPGKLGVLSIFGAEFVAPISIGGYANASTLQVVFIYILNLGFDYCTKSLMH